MAELVRAAQAYDLEHRSPGRNWSRVPDEQVLRLLTGAGIFDAPQPAAALREIRELADSWTEPDGAGDLANRIAAIAAKGLGES